MTEISARISASFWPARLPRSRRDLGEISKSRRPKTRRDSRRDRGEISKSRRPKTRRESRLDLGEISKSRRDSRRDLRILAAKNSLRFSPRSQNLGGQKLAENLGNISRKISARSQSLGGQKLVENLAEIRRDIKIIRRLKQLTEKTVRYFKILTLRS